MLAAGLLGRGGRLIAKGRKVILWFWDFISCSTTCYIFVVKLLEVVRHTHVYRRVTGVKKNCLIGSYNDFFYHFTIAWRYLNKGRTIACLSVSCRENAGCWFLDITTDRELFPGVSRIASVCQMYFFFKQVMIATDALNENVSDTFTSYLVFLLLFKWEPFHPAQCQCQRLPGTRSANSRLWRAPALRALLPGAERSWHAAAELTWFTWKFPSCSCSAKVVTLFSFFWVGKAAWIEQELLKPLNHLWAVSKFLRDVWFSLLRTLFLAVSEGEGKKREEWPSSNNDLSGTVSTGGSGTVWSLPVLNAL